MAIDVSGRWRNDVGSEIDLRHEGGVLRGAYRTAVGRPDESEGFPIAGVVNDDMLAMTVDFGEHGSVGAWTGRVVDGEGGVALHTLWHLVRNRSDDGEPLPPWSSTLAGAAVFRRVNP